MGGRANLAKAPKDRRRSVFATLQIVKAGPVPPVPAAKGRSVGLEAGEFFHSSGAEIPA